MEKKKKAKREKGLSDEEVCNHDNKTYETNLHHKRIRNLVAKRYIGVKRPRQGVNEEIPFIVYISICQAFDSHIKSNQCYGNPEENIRKNCVAAQQVV